MLGDLLDINMRSVSFFKGPSRTTWAWTIRSLEEMVRQWRRSLEPEKASGHQC